MNKIFRIAKLTPLLSFLFLLFSCASGISQKSGSKNTNSYKEDLSSFRPRISPDSLIKGNEGTNTSNKSLPLVPTSDITDELNKKLSSISESAPSIAKGYRINLYSGTSREEATIIKKKAEQLTQVNIYIQFRTPNFRVKAGDAINRLEASYLLSQLKSEFPGAVIVPDDININLQP